MPAALEKRIGHVLAQATNHAAPGAITYNVSRGRKEKQAMGTDLSRKSAYDQDNLASSQGDVVLGYQGSLKLYKSPNAA